MTDLDILYHDEVQLLDWGESRGGGKWIKLKLFEGDSDPLDAFRGLDTATAKKAGHIFNVTIVQGDIVAERDKPMKGQYGDEAKALHQSGFFRAPNVWLALGTDEEFQAWCRKQKCVVCGDKDYPEEYPEGVCEYAHVRRVANGAGTSTKPPYSGVPLCHKHHTLQHNKGELASYVAAATYDQKITIYSEHNAKDWFDKKRIQHLEKWAHYQLTKTLGAESLTEINPADLYLFCESNGINKYLPSLFK